MDTREVLLVDAFAAEPTTGVPAGVVGGAADLAADQRAAIARELGAPATAFVESGDDARTVTPVTPAGEEVDAIPALLAAHAASLERGVRVGDEEVDVSTGETTLTTPGGDRTVTVEDDGTVWFPDGDATVHDADCSHEDAASALGVDVASLRDVGADLPIGRVESSGTWLVVPVNYFEHLRAIDQAPGEVGALCDAAGADALYAFTFDTVSGASTLHARSFAPDGTEELAAPAAAGACCAYLRIHAALDGERDELLVEQGHFRDRPGTIRVRTDGDEVTVGGRATVAMDGQLVVPDAEDDEIIEV